MEASYHKTWSEHLQREMEYKTYGYAGRAVLVFPSQNQRFYEWQLRQPKRFDVQS